MDKEQFFERIMTACAWDKHGNDDEIIRPLVEWLSKQPDEEIFSFDDIMAELLYALDTRKNFETARKAYPHGDDSFLYSRCVALINGKQYYEKSLSGKKKDLWKMGFETILYVPKYAWGLKYNKSPMDYPHLTPLSYETGSNKVGWRK